jgi:hypothetical protein
MCQIEFDFLNNAKVMLGGYSLDNPICGYELTGFDAGPEPLSWQCYNDIKSLYTESPQPAHDPNVNLCNNLFR